jgi:hypothetical protein
MQLLTELTDVLKEQLKMDAESTLGKRRLMQQSIESIMDRATLSMSRAGLEWGEFNKGFECDAQRLSATKCNEAVAMLGKAADRVLTECSDPEYKNYLIQLLDGIRRGIEDSMQ